MANKVEPQLTDSLFEAFQSDHYVMLSSVDYETGGPNVNAISWVFAPDKQTLRFAVDNRSRIVTNIEHNQNVVISIISGESTYAIAGEATLLVQQLEEVPLKLALIEVEINEVRDVMFYGSKIIAEPQCDKTYDKQAAIRLDKQVMEAMKEA